MYVFPVAFFVVVMEAVKNDTTIESFIVPSPGSNRSPA